MTDASRWKTKNNHEIAQIYNNIDEHGSDADCLGFHNQQTRFQCSAFLRALETPELDARVLNARTFIISQFV